MGPGIQLVKPLLLLVVAVALLVPSPPPLGALERDPSLRGRTEDAIDRGVTWLVGRQTGDGSFPEFPGWPGSSTALAYYALRVAGASHDDPVTVRAWRATVRTNRGARLKTHSAATCLLALTARGEPAPPGPESTGVTLTDDEREWAAELAAVLVTNQKRDGCWSSGAGSSSRCDHGSAQMAILGLAAARRCSVEVDPSVWQRALAHFADAQQQRGPVVLFGVPVTTIAPRKMRGGDTRSRAIKREARGWGYGEIVSGAASPGVTAGIVAATLICRRELVASVGLSPRQRLDAGTAIDDGLAWVGEGWRPERATYRGAESRDGATPAVRVAPETLAASGPDYWAVERAADLAGVDWIGDVDWYGAGARALFVAQHTDGGWYRLGLPEHFAGASDPAQAKLTVGARVMETCHALLFLCRATTALVGGTTTPSTTASDPLFEWAATANDRRLVGDVVDLVLARWHRSRDARVRELLFDRATRLGPRIVPVLLAHLNCKEPYVRAGAHALLRRATALDFGYAATAPVGARKSAAARWRSWWLKAKD